MKTQTADIEDTVVEHLTDGPATLDQVMTWLAWTGDLRWVSVALVHLRRDGRIRWSNCDPDHKHTGRCVLELLS